MRFARCVAGVALVVTAGCGAGARSSDAPAAEPAGVAAAPAGDVEAQEATSDAAPAEPAAASAVPVAGAEPPSASEPVARGGRPRVRPFGDQLDALAAPAVAWFGDPATCPTDGHGAVVDRANQMGWLCDGAAIVREFPITTARSQPDPGTYPVYAKDLHASSTISGAFSRMTHFVAFTYGKYQGARIAFHSVPTYADGRFVQPLDSVGTQDLFGASAGCIRVLPDDAVAIWDWLGQGDVVHVIS